MRRFFSQIASVKQILKTAENGTNVCVRGWARSLRKQKSIAFIEIDDGTSVETLQIVVSDPKCIEGSELLLFGSFISVPELELGAASRSTAKLSRVKGERSKKKYMRIPSKLWDGLMR